MRQVPQNLKYLLIGGGRLARHMGFYLEKLNAPYSRWNRNDHSTADLIKKLKTHSIILLCINDDQISHFYEQFKNENSLFVHFSGSFEHEEILGFHPLMSFGHKLYELEFYKNIHFVGSHSPSLFSSLFPRLQNTYHQIQAEQKKLYHSLCVTAGNGTTLLWDLVSQEFDKVGLPKEALDFYLKQITENILENHKGRWTGPWYRNDENTIENNKKALDKTELKNLYIEMEKLSHKTGNRNEKRS